MGKNKSIQSAADKEAADKQAAEMQEAADKEAADKAAADKQAAEMQEAADKEAADKAKVEKPPYSVAKGKSITCLHSKILADGDAITAKNLAGGDKALQNLADKGYIDRN